MAEEAEKSERHKRRVERMRVAREATAPKRVRVNPRDDKIRSAFKNPPGRPGFPASGSIEWPLDQYTKRRLREGSITLEEGVEGRQERFEHERRQREGQPEEVPQAQAAREPEVKPEDEKRPASSRRSTTS